MSHAQKTSTSSQSEAVPLFPKPTALEVLPENIPTDLKERPQWLGWKFEPRINKKTGEIEYDEKGEVKWTKPPYNVKTGYRGKSNDPRTWATFEQAFKAYQSGQYDGIGFALKEGDRLTGLDLDHCVSQNGSLEPWAQEIPSHFPETYWELSPRSEGLHCFCYGTPARSGKLGPNNWIEVYQPPSSRYLTVTGHCIEDSAVKIGRCQDGLDWLFKQYEKKNDPQEEKEENVQGMTDDQIVDFALSGRDPKLTELWNTPLGVGDDSAVDQGLLNKLAYYCRKDPQQMDRVGRLSGRYREKWERKHYADGRTYIQGAIDKAIEGCHDVWEPSSAKFRQSSTKFRPSSTTPLTEKKSFQRRTWAELRKNINNIEWMWEGWLPRGLLTLLASEPGIGKSALALRIAHSVIEGIPWPNQTSFEGERGVVLWCEAESAEAINLERAEKWGVPLDSLWEPLGCDPPVAIQLDDPDHKREIEKNAKDNSVKLVIVDSLRGVHNRNENDSIVFDVVQWLASLARDSGKPILLTHHLRKKNANDGDEISLDRLRGTSAIVQPARVVWALDTPNHTNNEVKRLSVIKSNISKFPEPLGFSVREEGIWFGDAPTKPQRDTVVGRAMARLRVLLKSGPQPAGDILSILEAEGISKNSVYKAKDRLHLVTIPQGKRSLWALPSKAEAI